MSMRGVMVGLLSGFLVVLSSSACKQVGQAIQAASGDGEVIQLFEKEVRGLVDCTKECRDFQVVCKRAQDVSGADQLNGISERKTIGLKYVYLDGDSYKERERLGQYVKRNGAWVGESVQGVPDMKQCVIVNL